MPSYLASLLFWQVSACFVCASLQQLSAVTFPKIRDGIWIPTVQTCNDENHFSEFAPTHLSMLQASMHVKAGGQKRVLNKTADLTFATLKSGWQTPTHIPTTDNGVMKGGLCNSLDQECISSEAFNLTLAWLLAGGRSIDTGDHYKTQTAVGSAISQSGVNRSEIFISTKVPGTIGYQATMQCVDDALQMLTNFGGKDPPGYLDALAIHYPGEFDPSNEFFKPACQPPNCYQRFTNASLHETWRAMVELKRLGVVRSLGLSIFNSTDVMDYFGDEAMNKDLDKVSVGPQRIVTELLNSSHPYKQFLTSNNVTVEITFEHWNQLDSLIGTDTGTIEQIAGAHKATGSQVLRRWLLQQGFLIRDIPTTPRELTEMSGVHDFQLSYAEMQSLEEMVRKNG